jgi:small-conductance mechanosensitive channel
MKILSVLICVTAYLFITRAVNVTIRRLGENKQVSSVRIKYLLKTANIALFATFVFVACLVLGLGYSEISLFLSSVFAVVGVAMFAQWSILSNITASMVIFFGFPYRVGDRIKVTDSDFDLSGTVEEISLFHVLIRTDEGNIITYPNTLILQKPVIKLDSGNKQFPSKLFAPPKQPVQQRVSLRRTIREKAGT